jgi:putative endopeptidase
MGKRSLLGSRLAFTLTVTILALGLSHSALAANASTGIDPDAMDTKTNPCTDFYQYSCGGWMNKTTIPSDQSDWARSFSVINEQNLATLQTVLVDYSNGKTTNSSPYAAKLGSYFASCMNEGAVENQSAKAISSQLSEINKLNSKAALAGLVGKMHLKGAPAFFSFSAAADLHDSTLEIAEVDQGGMGLPDSGYYTKQDAGSQKIRDQYLAHIKAMLVLAGYSAADADAAAADVFAIEKSLGENALPPESLQDPTVLYHGLDLTALRAQTPDFNWDLYFTSLSIPAPKLINVTEAKFMAEVNNLVKNTDLGAIRNYLKFRTLESMAPALGKAIYAEWFDFNGKILAGRQVQAPRWKKCVQAVSGGMSEALGQAFVEKTFSPQAKKRAVELIANLHDAFKRNLQTLSWLDEKTRIAALEKLELITQKIGYPDKWRNYDTLVITRGSYWKNELNATVFENLRNLRKIGGKVDPSEWGMSPQTVNAYYDPSVNQINFPAGILQPPFFAEANSDAVNYGAIGMVIGHEMTHGFDTTGSQFDGHGVQNDWWSPAVKTLFQGKAQCLENQYSQYQALPDLKVNGKLTITENIADQGGLKLAFAAYKLASLGKPAEPAVAGLNSDQQFFVSMGQIWCEKQTDAALRRQVTGNPHSPAKFRVIGTMVNSADFAATFNCPVGTPMNPANRCEIW